MTAHLDFVGRESTAIHLQPKWTYRGPCYCREGITHWLDELDRCPACGGSLVAGPWSGEELVFGEVADIEHDPHTVEKLDVTVPLDEVVAVDDDWMIVLDEERELEACRG